MNLQPFRRLQETISRSLAASDLTVPALPHQAASLSLTDLTLAPTLPRLPQGAEAVNGVNDRANYANWKSDASPVPNPTPDKKAGPVWKESPAVPFKAPACQDKALWRHVRIYRDIALLCDNEAGECHASNAYFAGRYKKGRTTNRTEDGKFAPCSEASVRLWITTLVQCGWIGRRTCGPNRRLFLRVHPSQILATWPRFKGLFSAYFKRLLSLRLSGLEPLTYITYPDKDKTSNKRLPEMPPPTKEATLSEAEEGVVVQAAQAAVSGGWCREFVRKQGDKAVQALRDALEVLSYQQDKGKQIEQSGGYVRKWAESLLAGEWSLPAGLIKKREREAVERQRMLHQAEEVARVRQQEAEDKKLRQERLAQGRIQAEQTKKEVREVTLAAICDELRPHWDTLLTKLQTRVNKPTWETHIRGLCGASVAGDAGNLVVLTAPSAFTADWLQKRHTGDVSAVLREILGRVVEVRFQARRT